MAVQDQCATCLYTYVRRAARLYPRFVDIIVRKALPAGEYRSMRLHVLSAFLAERVHEGLRLVKKFRAESDERKPYSVNGAPIGANILQGDNKNAKPVITKRRNGTTENKNPNGPRGVLKRKILEESLLRPLFRRTVGEKWLILWNYLTPRDLS